MIRERKLKQSILFYMAILIILPIALNWVSVLPIQKAKAASLTAVSDTMSTNQASAYSNHTIKFTTPTGVAVPSKTIIFTFTGIDPSHACDTEGQNKLLSYGPTTGLENNVTMACGAAGNNLWGFANDATTLTFTSPSVGGTAIPAGSVIVFRYDSTDSHTGMYGMQNSATPGTYKVSISGSFGDTGSAGIVIVADDTIGVSANVDPSLAFTMTNTTVTFGTLSPAARSTSSPVPVMTASTNGASGIVLSIYDLGNGTGGLWSSTVSQLLVPAASSAVATGSEGFGVYGSSPSSLTLDAGFDNNGAGDLAISNVAKNFATSSGPVASGAVSMNMYASINSLTKAGAYTDTVTVVCTGRF